VSFLTVCLNPTLQKTLRFSSIVPDAVNRTGIHRLDASGKGVNVTRVLTQLGKKAFHLTQLGGVMRPLFLSLCKKDKLYIDWVESGSEIRFCYTVLNESNGKITELVEESNVVSAGTEKRLLERYDSILDNALFGLKCVIISGTKAAGFSDAVIPSMTRNAKEKGLKVILDVKGKDLIESLKYEPDVVKPNLLEFTETFAPDLINDNDLVLEDDEAKEKIYSMIIDMTQKYNCCVILTNGSRDIIAADGDYLYRSDFGSIKALNSTGCGDAFTAGLAAALEDGAGFKDAIGEGARCGALNAGLLRPGVIR